MPDPLTEDLELQLLGIAQVRNTAGTVALRSRRALAMLGILALEGHAPRSRIASLLWSELDPDRARRNLRRELHRLRESGCDALVLAGDNALALAPLVRVDVHAFNRAQAAGDAQAALALYRGPFLAGLDEDACDAYLQWLAGAREGLAQQFRQVVQARIQACERAGEPREALRWQLRLISDDSLQEQHFRAAMQLHAELGEREAALDLYERCRNMLGNELGLQPMPETRALAERIRDGRFVRSDATEPRHRTPPARTTAAEAEGVAAEPLVGRAEILAGGLLAVQRNQAVLLDGDAGIGKTRLACAAAGSCGRFALAAARPSDARTPYAPVARMLRAMAPTSEWARLPPWALRELARLLPDLGPSAPEMRSATDRLRLFAAIDAAVAQAHAAGVRALVFDDWHHADDASVQWWSHAVDGGLGSSMALWVTLRAAELPKATALALETQQRAGRAVRFDVPPLGGSESADLLASRAGAPLPAALAERLHERCGGNPFYLLEVLAQWLGSGRLRRSATGQWIAADATPELPLPPSVREAVLAGLAGLDDAARRLLEAASIVGDPFNPVDLAEVTALSDWECVAAAERALAARVLVADANGSLRFHHDLVSQTLAAALAAPRRRLLHLRLAASLERSDAAPERIAQHLELAGAPRRAVRWRVAAAEAAARVFAHAAALQHYAAALDNQPTAAQAIDILLVRAQLLGDLSRSGDADADLAGAEKQARDSGKPALLLRVLLAKADRWSASNRIHEALALIEDLLEAGAMHGAEAARALEVRAYCMSMLGRTAQSQSALHEALARLPRGASAARGRLWLALARSAMSGGQFAAAQRDAERASAVFAVTGLAAEMASATVLRGAAEMNLGHYARAIELMEQGRAAAAAAGRIPTQRAAILNLVKLHTQTGAVTKALALLDAGEALSAHYEHPTAEGAFLQARYYCHYLEGQLAEAFAMVPRVLAHCDRIEEVYWQVGVRQLVVDLFVLTGDLDTAQRLMAEARVRCASNQSLYQEPLIEIKSAWIELLRGEPRQAQARLHVLNSSATPTLVEALDTRKYVEAAVHLALGDAPAALSVVDRPAAACTQETRALQWACRIHAEILAGGVQHTTAAAASEALAEGRLPALESLILRRALALALRAAADAGADEAEASAEAARSALLARLGALPAVQARVARVYPGLRATPLI